MNRRSLGVRQRPCPARPPRRQVYAKCSGVSAEPRPNAIGSRFMTSPRECGFRVNGRWSRRNADPTELPNRLPSHRANVGREMYSLRFRRLLSVLGGRHDGLPISREKACRPPPAIRRLVVSFKRRRHRPRLFVTPVGSRTTAAEIPKRRVEGVHFSPNEANKTADVNASKSTTYRRSTGLDAAANEADSEPIDDAGPRPERTVPLDPVYEIVSWGSRPLSVARPTTKGGSAKTAFRTPGFLMFLPS